MEGGNSEGPQSWPDVGELPKASSYPNFLIFQVEMLLLPLRVVAVAHSIIPGGWKAELGRIQVQSHQGQLNKTIFFKVS